MIYVFLDTCVIVDCAYTRHEQANPTLLDKVIECCKSPTAKLLLSEVVLLELDKVSKARAQEVNDGLREVEQAVERIAEKKTIGIDSRKALVGLIKESKKQIISSAEDAFTKVRNLSKDGDRASLIPMVADDLVAAVGMALQGANPSKSKEVVGLLQGDCLIVAGLERFAREHPEDHIVICSSNTKDFATKDDQGWHLYPEIAERVPRAEFYCNPVEVLEAIKPDISEAERTEREELKESYDSVAKERESIDYAGVLSAMRTMADVARQVEKERIIAVGGLASALRTYRESSLSAETDPGLQRLRALFQQAQAPEDYRVPAESAVCSAEELALRVDSFGVVKGEDGETFTTGQ